MKRTNIFAFAVVAASVLLGSFALDGLAQGNKGKGGGGGGGEPPPPTTPAKPEIAFRLDGGLHVMDADGSNITRITDTSINVEGKSSWSPCGNHIIFKKSVGGDVGDLMVIDVVVGADGRVTGQNPRTIALSHPDPYAIGSEWIAAAQWASNDQIIISGVETIDTGWIGRLPKFWVMGVLRDENDYPVFGDPQYVGNLDVVYVDQLQRSSVHAFALSPCSTRMATMIDGAFLGVDHAIQIVDLYEGQLEFIISLGSDMNVWWVSQIDWARNSDFLVVETGLLVSK